MKPSVYIETTIVSYIVARPARDSFILGCQRLTRRWWREKRRKFELYTSATVIEEASRGEAGMVRKRVALLKQLKQLAPSSEIAVVTAALLASGAVPPKVESDGIHIAFAAIHGVDFLLTWNCTHLANPCVHDRVSRVLNECGYAMPAIVTPMQLEALAP